MDAVTLDERCGTRNHANADIIPCNYMHNTDAGGSGLFIFTQHFADEMEFNVLRRDNCRSLVHAQSDLSIAI